MTGCTCSDCTRMRAHTDLIRRRLRALERPTYFTSTDAAPVEQRLPEGGSASAKASADLRRRTAVAGAVQADWAI